MLGVSVGMEGAFVVNRAWLGAEGSASAVVWVDGVFVSWYTGGETLGVESLASICKMWLRE